MGMNEKLFKIKLFGLMSIIKKDRNYITKK